MTEKVILTFCTLVTNKSEKIQYISKASLLQILNLAENQILHNYDIETCKDFQLHTFRRKVNQWKNLNDIIYVQFTLYNKWHKGHISFILLLQTNFCMLFFDSTCFITNSAIWRMHRIMAPIDFFNKAGKSSGDIYNKTTESLFL